MTRFFCVFLTSFLVSEFGFVSVNAVIGEGTYVISHDEDGEKLSLVATPPKDGKKWGEVFVKEYQDELPFHWKVKLSRGNWLYSLTPEANAKNTITENEHGKNRFVRDFRFVQVSDEKYRVEEIVGRRAPRCLTYNGPQNPVSLGTCSGQGSSVLWKFDILSV